MAGSASSIAPSTASEAASMIATPYPPVGSATGPIAITSPVSTRGVQYSRWARMSWASSDVISEMNVGRGGLSLQKEWGMSSWIRSGQAFVNEGLELRQVFRHETGRGRGRGGASRIARALRLAAELAEHPFEIGLDEAPGPHVLGLLLTPDHLRCLETGELPHQRLDRERIELLDPQQVDVVDAALLALVIEIVVDLARADDNAADVDVLGELDLFALVRLGVIPQQAVKARSRAERFEVGDRALVAQHRLRGHRDQRLAELAFELAPQRVKEICRRRADDDLHIVLGTKLEIALEASR